MAVGVILHVDMVDMDRKISYIRNLSCSREGNGIENHSLVQESQFAVFF